MEENGGLSPSMPAPLQLLTPRYDGEDFPVCRQLAVVAPTTPAITTTSGFKLPEGWDVENVPRPDGSKSDKYYREPGSGHKFRSLKDVERYLTGVEYTPSGRALKRRNHVSSSGSRKMISSGGMLLRLSNEESNRLQSGVVAPIISAATSPFNLPDGWVVKEVSRRCAGQTDKYYYEPGTGRMFRSLISVERYLEEVGDNAPLSQMFKSCSHVRKKVFREKLNTSPSDFAQPPAKINWVLADSEGFTWNPFIGESMVPEAVKQRWANRFIISINEKDRGATDVAQLS